MLLGLIWGSSFLWVKIAVQEIGPFTFVALNFLFGILALSAVVAYLRPEWPKTQRLWLVLVLLGAMNVAIPYVLISWGEQHVDSAVAAIVLSSVPLFTSLMAHFFIPDERLTIKRFLGLLVGFSGVFILLYRDPGADLQTSLLGHGALLLAAFMFGLSAVFARRNVRGISPIVQTLITLIAADIIVWMIAPFIEHPLSLPQLPITWTAILWVGFIGSCVAYLIFFYLIQTVGPTRTTMVNFFYPLVGTTLGVLLLNETLDWLDRP